MVSWLVVRQRQKLTSPALAHTTSFTPSKTSTVLGATRQARAETMSKLVDNDTSFHVTITVGVSGVPEVHSAFANSRININQSKENNNSPILAIGRRHEIGIVETTAILCIRNHSV
jgi:hypothetical protein